LIGPWGQPNHAPKHCHKVALSLVTDTRPVVRLNNPTTPLSLNPSMLEAYATSRCSSVMPSYILSCRRARFERHPSKRHQQTAYRAYRMRSRIGSTEVADPELKAKARGDPIGTRPEGRVLILQQLSRHAPDRGRLRQHGVGVRQIVAEQGNVKSTPTNGERTWSCEVDGRRNAFQAW
jgi:hypothetical protein